MEVSCEVDNNKYREKWKFFFLNNDEKNGKKWVLMFSELGERDLVTFYEIAAEESTENEM